MADIEVIKQVNGIKLLSVDQDLMREKNNQDCKSPHVQTITIAQDQQLDLDLINQVRHLLRMEFELNSQEYSEGHYHDIMDERSPFICWRYLIHCRLNVNEAVALIKSALVWRKQNKVDQIRNEEFVKEFWHLAPIMFTGQTKTGQDVLYVIGKNYRKPDPIMQETIRRFTLNALFTWDKKHRDDTRKFYVVFDVSETGFRNLDLDYMYWLVSIRDFIPARIHQIFVVGIPTFLRPIVRLVINWLPENFKRIVHCGSFEELVVPNIDKCNWPVEVGGTNDQRCRLAPVEASWIVDSSVFSTSIIQKAIENSIGFNVESERRNQLRIMQLEHENKQLVIEQ